MAKKGKKKAKSSSRTSPRLALRAVIDDLERGNCSLAASSLVSAARAVGTRRKGKLPNHLAEVTASFKRICVRGDGNRPMTPAQRTMHAPARRQMPAEVTPALRDHFTRLHREGRLSPQAPRPSHGAQDERWYGAGSSGGGAVLPSVHTHPFEGHGRRRRGR